MAHSIRLLTSAIEILETGDFSTYRQNREHLLECREGKYTFEEAVEMIAEYDTKLKEAANRYDLPKTPDYQKINRMLVELNKRGLELYPKLLFFSSSFFLFKRGSFWYIQIFFQYFTGHIP